MKFIKLVMFVSFFAILVDQPIHIAGADKDIAMYSDQDLDVHEADS